MAKLLTCNPVIDHMLLDQEASKTFLEDIRRIWFNPELERLRHIGSVKEDYQPEKMQVILFPDGEKHILFDDLLIPKEKLEANSKKPRAANTQVRKAPTGVERTKSENGAAGKKKRANVVTTRKQIKKNLRADKKEFLQILDRYQRELIQYPT